MSIHHFYKVILFPQGIPASQCSSMTGVKVSHFLWVGQALFLVQAVRAPQPHLLSSSPPPLHPPPGALLWVALEELAALSCRWPHGIAVFYYG